MLNVNEFMHIKTQIRRTERKKNSINYLAAYLLFMHDSVRMRKTFLISQTDNILFFHARPIINAGQRNNSALDQ